MFTARFYKTFSGLSSLGILVLFFLGGLVRITGSGMGCPDWPKCFDQWVPPTGEEGLPADYKEIYVDKRKKKIERLTGLLRKIGMNDQAIAIETNPYALEAHPYSFKTAYIEYVNRLWGALVGIFALLALVSSFQFWKEHRSTVILTALGVFMVVFNGWLGSIVVDTNLLEGMVSTHFIAAFLAFTFFFLAYKLPVEKVKTESNDLPRLKWFAVLILALVSIQIVSGAFVRETADQFLRLGGIDWLTNSEALWSSSFVIHRYIPALVIVSMLMTYMMLRRGNFDIKFSAFRWLVVVYMIQGLFGGLNLWFGNPAFAQLVHVTVGGFAFALAMNWFIEVNRLKIA